MIRKIKLQQYDKLIPLGWCEFFQGQVNDTERIGCKPVRVVAEHRGSIITHDGINERRLKPGRQWKKSRGHRKPIIGDWLLVDLITGQECRILNPRNILTRISAGVRAGQKIQEQAIAANIDALFIVTSANNEFNESRLERYLALAKKYEVKPVIIITKNDLIKDGQSYRKRALAITDTPILLVDARDKKLKSKLNQWLKIGNTIAVFGSSGVGKSTILNTLAGSNIQKTGTVRVTDNRGRHTTTSRTIHLLKDGPMILDTPGIRELTLAPSKEVLSEIFADIETFFHSCKFANCTHNSEPGCAIQEALEQEKIDKRRLDNYQKLCAEHLFYAQVIEGSIEDNFDHKGRRKVPKEGGKNSTKRSKRKC